MLRVTAKFRKEPRPDQLASLLRVLFPIVQRSRTEAALLANEFYASERRKHTKEPSVPPETLAYDINDFVTGVRNRYDDKGAEELARAVVTTATRHTEDAANRTLLDSVDQDQLAKGWTRVHLDPKPACSFCRLLIGRGAVYGPSGFASHDHDKCIVVPIFTGQTEWVGKAVAEQYSQDYARTTRGLNGRDALNAWRRFVYSQTNS